MQLAFPATETPILPISGSDKGFPVHRVFCIGKNYAAHVVEMGGDPRRQAPVFFMKPADSVVPLGGRVPYPPMTGELHYEGEMVVALEKGGAHIDPSQALGHVFGYGAGIDFTRRDIQAAAREKGLPWDMAKSFDAAAPVSALLPVGINGHPSKSPLTLTVNGQVRQEGCISDMVWGVADAIAELSKYIALKPGDLLFTGTPEGVGAVSAGDELECSVGGVGTVSVSLY